MPVAKGGEELADVTEEIGVGEFDALGIAGRAAAEHQGGDVVPVDLDPLFSDCLVLVGHLLRHGSITVTRTVATRRRVTTHRN